MDAESAIRSRRSIRKFRPDPVPRDLIRQVLDTARWSPSWANTQCWGVIVVDGPAVDKIRKEFRRLAEHGLPGVPDFAMPRQWPPALQARSGGLVKALSAARDASRLPTPTATMLDFFGAPCLLLVTVDKDLVPDYACFDAGLFVQSLCLAAHAQGLGTCIMARAVRYPEVLREMLPGAAGRKFVIGLALGYPDPDSPLNAFERPRAPLDEIASFVG